MKIVIVGLSGVPFSQRAIDVRLNATINLFVKLKYDVVVLNRFQSIGADIPHDKYELINPFGKCSCRSHVLSALLYFVALLLEPLRLFKINHQKHIDVLFVNSGHFIDVFLYRIIATIIGAKIVYQYCEFRAAFGSSNPYHRVNGILLARFGAKLWDGAICITSFLEEQCKNVNPGIRTIKMYPICNYSEFDIIEPYVPDYSYVMFCGSVEYAEVVKLIIDAYRKSRIKNRCKLLLVLRGNKSIINRVRDDNPDFIVESDLAYNDLIARYKGATALLIPIQDSIRDIARFPNKICEYCAAKSAVVTTNNGEVKSLFVDGVNAFVADAFSVSSYSDALDRLADSDCIAEIANSSYELGLNRFNIDSYCEEMSAFIEDLVR